MISSASLSGDSQDDGPRALRPAVRVYDLAQARIEAESVKAIMEKYQGNEDLVYRTRALNIKEQRAELVKHHLWVLWTDYFKPNHFEKYPQLHGLFNAATKQAGAAGGKGTVDLTEGRSCSTRSKRFRRSSGRPSRPEQRRPRGPSGRGQPSRGVADDGNDAVHGCGRRAQAAVRCDGCGAQRRTCAVSGTASSSEPGGDRERRCRGRGPKLSTASRTTAPRPRTWCATWSRSACPPTGRTCPSCARPPRAWLLASTSPWMRSRTSASPSTRPARCCCRTPNPAAIWAVRSSCRRTP